MCAVMRRSSCCLAAMEPTLPKPGCNATTNLTGAVGVGDALECSDSSDVTTCRGGTQNVKLTPTLTLTLPILKTITINQNSVVVNDRVRPVSISHPV